MRACAKERERGDDHEEKFRAQWPYQKFKKLVEIAWIEFPAAGEEKLCKFHAEARGIRERENAIRFQYFPAPCISMRKGSLIMQKLYRVRFFLQG